MRVFSRAELNRHHKRAHRNEFGARGASHAGCFCCLEVFEPSAVRHWTDNRPNRTALCPRCHVDSVLFSRLGPIDLELLTELERQYFGYGDVSGASSFLKALQVQIKRAKRPTFKGSKSVARRRVRREVRRRALRTG